MKGDYNMTKLNLPEAMESETIGIVVNSLKTIGWETVMIFGLYKLMKSWFDAGVNRGKYNAYSEVEDAVGKEIKDCQKIIDCMNNLQEKK